MLARIGESRIELLVGDITRQAADAIVNAANSQLAGGGGVDGAIHHAAGPALMQETARRYPEGCPTGQAVATTAGRLAARYVFHAVGPVWKGGRQGEPDLLANAYRRCLELAIEHDCASIAMPAISTGVYGYPIDLAAQTALGTTREFLIARGRPSIVRFVLFSEGAYGAFARTIEAMFYPSQ
ncbi:O-acetyl-ADP-ribose deacetylase [Caulifigura coniformis]|uniref:O-acetyl-ADP-ribose deacetylase n=1 Tax=Caulifigura coniformis TaxID=2527983 RepID=A0A517SHY4_9PLAN|nr:O-acetyl-ADP-ribose deacetylase [Caulifigura coniformis]QDT55732.1 O-acetyl-ADP-ribose deacetylase [Caulifigura coniformis]